MANDNLRKQTMATNLSHCNSMCNLLARIIIHFRYNHFCNNLNWIDLRNLENQKQLGLPLTIWPQILLT
jgi:hypothetical protein